MKSVIIIEVTHTKPIPRMANLIAGRAYMLAGVTDARPVKLATLATDERDEDGFTLSELSLGAQEIVRT